MHHDQIFGDFAGDGTNQLAFWVQKSEILWLSNTPRDPRQIVEPWEMALIARVGPGEGMAKADIDGDGKIDLIGGGFWFKHRGGNAFQSMLINKKSLNSRAAAGQIVEGGSPEVVFVIGDGIGRLKWFELCDGEWVGHDLLGEDVAHGHSLELADIDRDGHLDIYCAEMAQWTEGAKTPDNPGARMWIFYGDGQGRFTKTLLARGIDNHESRVSDLDGDDDLDIVVKPYTHRHPEIGRLAQSSAPGRARRASKFRLTLRRLMCRIAANTPSGDTFCPRPHRTIHVATPRFGRFRPGPVDASDGRAQRGAETREDIPRHWGNTPGRPPVARPVRLKIGRSYLARGCRTG